MKTSRLLYVITTAAHLGLFLALAPPAQALPPTTVILSETFEGRFPEDNGWAVGNSHPMGATAYWDDVDAAFGGEGTHTLNRKGYCAGEGFDGTTDTPSYPINLESFMSRSVNLTVFSSANLTFWFKIPDIETCCDRAQVFMDGVLLWEAGSPVADWTQVNINLNVYLGGMHTLKFNFHSGSSVTREGWYLDDILVTGFVVAPTNDIFARCTPLADDEGTVSGHNYNATSETGSGEPANYERTVWWCWTAPSDGIFIFDTLGSDFDTTLSVYTGSAVGSLTELDFNNDIASPLRHSLVHFFATAGTPYRIRVDGYGGKQGNIMLRWQPLEFAYGLAYTNGTGTKTTLKLPKLCVGNTNVSGVGSVRFASGASEGMEFGLTPLDFSAPASAFHIEARGNVRGMTNQLIGRSTFRHSGNATVATSADFSAIGSTSSIIQFRDVAGALLSSFPIANGTELHLQPCPPAGEPIQVCANTFMLSEGRPVASWQVCPAQCVLASEEGTNAPGRVEELASIWIIGALPPLHVIDPEPALRSVESVEVSSQGFTMFTLESAALRLNGLFHHGGHTMDIRSVACDAPGTPPCRLTGSRLVRPFGYPEWVTIALNRAVSYRAALDTGGADLNPPLGTYLRLTASGNVGGVSSPLGELRLTKTTFDWRVTADYTPVGSTSHRVELYNRGRLVGHYTGHTGEVARLPFPQRLPEGYGKGGQIPWPPSAPCFVCMWLTPQIIVIPLGATVTVTTLADELRVLAENPSAPLRYLESFTIGAVGLDSFALSNESAIPAVLAPLQIQRQTNGVLITLQTEVSRGYRLEYTAELQTEPTWPFLPPASPWLMLQTIQGNGLMQTFLDPSVNGGIAGGGRRFYRLRALDP